MKRLLFFCVLVALIAASILSSARPAGAESNLAIVLQQLSMEEKIGQLFLVTFRGKETGPNSDIYRLITQYHIGGILLQRENGNWRSGSGEAAAVVQLTNSLQQIGVDWKEEHPGAQYIPLFLALSQPGGGYPFDQLATDVTQLPSQMAIGATWKTSRAEDSGRVLGKELSSLGINLLFGPTLDVLERPNPGTSGDLGIRAFGGDPFWVGEMGRAYIRGVREGSAGRLALVAMHFPGIGGSDRSPDAEVATVRKSLEDLRQIDLAPFAAVTRGIPGGEDIIDALLVSHIRYQGLQGNIRANIRPVSLDPQALTQLMGLEEFSAWRNGGGVTISDSLGTQSVRLFYDPTGVTFYNQYIALNAFQAGNDILQLSNFSSPEAANDIQNIEDTIKFFQQKYTADTEFAEQVDLAVARILALKNRLYPQFTTSSVLITADPANILGKSQSVAQGVCRDGASLISPNLEAGSELDLDPPAASDRIVIFTDSRQLLACPGCALELDFSPTAFSETILRLYGPTASGYIQSSHISSFTLKELHAFLQAIPSPDLENALNNATMIIGLLRNPVANQPETSAFQVFLAQRPDIIRNKRIIVFETNAPYYLDSTEISKIDAFFALYSKTGPCIETAARLLFRDTAVQGNSPVSVEGVEYNLLTVLSPDPDQLIQIGVEKAEHEAPGPTPSPEITPTGTLTPGGYALGDTLKLTAGPIVDHNRHLVPDGTVIRFQISFATGNIPPLYLDTTTKEGVGVIEYTLDREGEIQITAFSEPAMNSTIIKLSTGEQPVFMTPLPEDSAIGKTPTAQLPSTPESVPTPGPSGFQSRSGLDTLAGALLVIGLLTGAGVYFAWIRYPSISPWRLALAAVVGGLAGYDYIAIGFPGADALVNLTGTWVSVLFGGIGCAVVLLAMILSGGEMRWPGSGLRKTN